MVQLNAKDRDAALLFIEANFKANNIAAALQASRSAVDARRTRGPGRRVLLVVGGPVAGPKLRLTRRGAWCAPRARSSGSPMRASSIAPGVPKMPRCCSVPRRGSRLAAPTRVQRHLCRLTGAARARGGCQTPVRRGVGRGAGSCLRAARPHPAPAADKSFSIPAIHDAQRLVSILPQSASDRLPWPRPMRRPGISDSSTEPCGMLSTTFPPTSICSRRSGRMSESRAMPTPSTASARNFCSSATWRWRESSI